MNEIQANRLLKLADFLENEVDVKYFDQHTYGISYNPKHENKEGSIVEFCGTSACALGWATAVFPSKFKLNFGDYEEEVCGRKFTESNVLARNDKDCYWLSYLSNVEKEVENFFGLNPHERNKIFGIHQSTPTKKANQIRSLVKENTNE